MGSDPIDVAQEKDTQCRSNLMSQIGATHRTSHVRWIQSGLLDGTSWNGTSDETLISSAHDLPSHISDLLGCVGPLRLPHLGYLMSRSSINSRLARMLCLSAVLGVAASCGGGGDGDGTTTPTGTVARVEFAAPSPTMEVGQNMQTTVRYFDASSSQLSGRTVTYASSNTSVASVSSSGLVTAAAPGPVTITATVDGVVGNLPLTVTLQPIFFIAITPAAPSVRPGETVTLTAEPQNALGVPITGRTVSWSSANTALATITQGGVVTGITPGTTYIRASADGRTDSVSLRVRSLNAPSITGTSSVTLAPGGTGSLTGVNFGATTADNEVLLNGVSAAITSASSTSVTFVVPSRAQLPCSATGPVPVTLIANGDTARATMHLRVATDHSLDVGQYLLLTAEPELLCNEFSGAGGKYLVTAFNFASSSNVRTSFRLTGSGQGGVAAVGGPTLRDAPSVAQRPWVMPETPQSRHQRAHSIFMDRDRELARQLGNPQLRRRMRQTGAAAAIAPPAVGENKTYRMPRTISSVTTYDEVNFRVVYSGTKLVILEDVASPQAGQWNNEYVRLGEEFDQTMYGQLLAFGDPLVVDSALDNNGRMLALFSPKVNNYTIAGLTNQILGYVMVCDFFLRTECPASNEAEAFYAVVPNPTGGGFDVSTWRRLMRGTLIHEAKHIASYAWRYYFEASELEERWLEEATAQQASELWARSIYNRGSKQDVAWADGPQCDYASAGGACPDPAEGILHHFGFLYEHYTAQETKSIFGDPAGGIDPVIYGSSWSFIRYVTDTYAQSEAAFLSSMVKVQNDRGVANVVSKSGKPFSELFGMFSLASAADNYPGVNLTDPKLRLASWNSRDLFQNMSDHLVFSDGSKAFPLRWPLQTRNVSFGNFTPLQSDVVDLRGGGFLIWELSGTQAGPQALAIRSSTGGTPPQLIGMTILRIQ